MSAPAPKVAVCAATYLRPQGLTRLLEALDRLTFPRMGAAQVEVVIVDNDPGGSARAVCDALRPGLRWPLRYAWEEQRGISFARNRAVREAAPDADFIAFVDDDEIPEPTWLDEMLAVQREHAADLVAGPVVPEFEETVPDWIVRGRFFDLPRYATGERIEHAGTGNVLIRAALLREMAEPFDTRMALSGGEDTIFFLRLAREGRTMVWADEALIRETVPPSRARAGWILQRAYRVGNTWSLCERELRPSPKVSALRVAKGLARIAQGVVLLPLAAVRGWHVAVQAGRYISVGAGNLAGIAGVQYQEYRTRAGR